MPLISLVTSRRVHLTLAATVSTLTMSFIFSIPAIGAMLTAILVGVGVFLWSPFAAEKDAQAELGAALIAGAVISASVFFLQSASERRVRREAERTSLNFLLSSTQDLTGIDLSHKDASGAYLFGKRLDRARLRAAKFNGAVLAGALLSNIDAANVELLGRVNAGRSTFDNVTLRASHLQFACLAGASLKHFLLVGGDGARMDLRGTTGDISFKSGFRGSDIDLTGAHLIVTSNGARLERAILRDAELVSAVLPGSTGNGTHSTFLGGTLTGANLSGSLEPTNTPHFGPTLWGARFDGVDLSGADFRGSKLPLDGPTQDLPVGDSIWSRISPRESITQAVALHPQVLQRDAELSSPARPRADCSGSGRNRPPANFTQIPFSAIAYTGADLRGADFSRALHPEKALWAGAIYDHTTQFPSPSFPARYGLIRLELPDAEVRGLAFRAKRIGSERIAVYMSWKQPLQNSIAANHVLTPLEWFVTAGCEAPRPSQEEGSRDSNIGVTRMRTTDVDGGLLPPYGRWGPTPLRVKEVRLDVHGCRGRRITIVGRVAGYGSRPREKVRQSLSLHL